MAPPSRPTAVRPFRALHYAQGRVRIEDVVAPPYDVITPEDRATLLARSPYNVVRLILPDAGAESEVNDLFCGWQGEGVIVQDPEPCFYWVEQDYVGPDGVSRSRGGFIGLVRLEPYGARVVRPHERTHEGPKEGRLRLLRATRAQLSPVFALYDDPLNRAEEALRAGREDEPQLDVTDRRGTRHRLWRVPGAHAEVIAAMAEGPLLIADGHHRYETALAYQAERGGPDADGPAAWTMMYLANAAAPGLQIYPTHRIVRGVPRAVVDDLPARLEAAGFAVEVLSGADPDALAAAVAATGNGPAAGLWRPGAAPLLARLTDVGALAGVPAPLRGLDVTAADRLILPRVLGVDEHAEDISHRLAYQHRAADAAALAAEEGDAVAVLLRAPTVHDVEAVADIGEVMPQKSTYFYPKTVDGFVFYDLDSCG